MNFTVPVVSGVARIEADKTAIQKLGLQQVVPQPTQNFGSDRLGPIQFQAPDPNAKTVFLQLSMQPGSIGRVKSNYRLNGKTTVEIHQLILP